jgi:hypothetical protein
MAEVPIAGWDGIVWVPEEQLTSEEVSEVGSHLNTIGAYLAGDYERVEQSPDFEGRVIAGVELVSDWDRIDELGAEHKLDIDEFYREGGA